MYIYKIDDFSRFVGLLEVKDDFMSISEMAEQFLDDYLESSELKGNVKRKLKKETISLTQLISSSIWGDRDNLNKINDKEYFLEVSFDIFNDYCVFLRYINKSLSKHILVDMKNENILESKVILINNNVSERDFCFCYIADVPLLVILDTDTTREAAMHLKLANDDSTINIPK
jgi:hypothetical protein